MPKIVISERQVQLPRSTGATPPSPAAAARSDLIVAETASRIGGQFAEFADRVQTAEAGAISASRMAAAQQDFDAYFAERSTRPDDYGTLADDVSGRLSEIRGRAFDSVSNPKAQALLEQRFAAFETSARSQAVNVARRQQIEYAVRETGNALESNAVNAANAKRPADRQRIIDDSLALLQAQVDAGLMSAPVADEARQKFLSEERRQGFERLINENPREALRILDGSKPIENLDPDTRNSLRRSARAEVNTLDAANLKIAKRTVDDALFSLENGFLPPNLDEAIRLAGTDPSLAADMRLARAQYEVIADRTALPPQEMAAWIDRQRGRTSMSRGEIEVLQAVERAYSKQQVLANEDPLRLAVQKGMVREVPPIDFSNPDAMAVGLAERRAAASVASAHLGEPVSPLYKSEAEALLRILDTGGVDTQVDALGAVAAGLDSEVGGFLHMLDKQGEHTYAQIGELTARGERQAALQLANGRKIVETDNAAAPKEADFRVLANEYLADAFGGRPRDQANIVKNARLLYVARGGDPVTVNTDLMREAVDTLVGGFVDYSEQVAGFRGDRPYRSGFVGSQRLPAPAPGVTEDQFVGWIRGLTPQDVKRAGGAAGFEDNPEQVLRWVWRQENDARLVTYGRGLYGVEIIGADGQHHPLRSAADPSQPFLLDWEAR